MIVIRRFKDKDLNDLKNLLVDSNIEEESPSEDDFIYVVFEDEAIIGAVKAHEKNDIWVLDYLYIDSDWRNKKIGDGLLRVILDKLDRGKITTLYFYGFDGYLVKRGFKKNEDDILEIDVENFFKEGCSCGDRDDV